MESTKNTVFGTSDNNQLDETIMDKLTTIKTMRYFEICVVLAVIAICLLAFGFQTAGNELEGSALIMCAGC